MTAWERWQHRLRMIWFGLTLKPIAGADDGDEEESSDDSGDSGGESGESSGEGSDDSGGKDGDEGEPADGGDAPTEDERKVRAEASKLTRRYERQAKNERQKREKLEKQLKEREDADKSEQEKAIEKARSEGEESARKQHEAERRQDRLESACVREAARGVTIKVDDEDKRIRFADPEDAQLHLQRAIGRGDVDEAELFGEDGRVNSDVLKSTLGEILEEKAYLRAAGDGEKPKKEKPKGGADGGAGKEGGEKDLEEMSVDEHLKRIQAERGKDRVITAK